MTKVYFILILLLLFKAIALAQTNISSGVTVSENFNGMGSSGTAQLSTGWRAETHPTERVIGPYPTAITYINNIGSAILPANAGGIYNFGAGTNMTGGTDRCLGGLTTSTARTINIYLALHNNGTTPIPGFLISYTLEKYRNGSNLAGFTIQLYYSTDGTSWSPANTGFQNNFPKDANNNNFISVPGLSLPVSKVLTLPASVPPNSNLYLAWSYSVTYPGINTTNAQAWGIDDVSITALSPFTSPLPTNFLRFTGERKADKNQLLWSTATEANNKGFELQRSADGTSYQPIGFIPSSATGGNSIAPIDYNFNDYDFTGVKQFYRLKQIDLDGKVNFSPVVLIQDEKIGKISIVDLYPNPASGTIALTVDAPARNRLTCSIIDIAGYTVKQVLLNAEAGTNVFRIDIVGLRPGIYYLKCIRTSGGAIIRKFVVQ